MKQIHAIRRLLLASATLAAVNSAHAQNHYWDSDGNTAGFGSTAGTWGTDAFWTTVASGGPTHSGVTNLTTSDTANFGSATLNYGNATVGVASGGVTATSIVFGAGQTTALTIGNAGSGTITLGGSTRTVVANITGHTIASELALTGTTTVRLAHALNSSLTTLTLGKLSGTGGVTFENTAGNNPLATFILTQASTYSGNTILQTTTNNSRVELQLGIANALPTSTVLNLQGNNGDGTGRTTSLNLAGYDQTLGGLSNSGGGGLRTFRVFSSSASTLTINDNGNRTFSGLIGNGGTNIAVVKDGTGTWTLSGDNSFANGLTLKGTGALTLAHSNAAGTGAINLQSEQTEPSATLNLSGNINVSNAIVIDSATGRESINSSGNNTLSGNITIDNTGDNLIVFNNSNAANAGTTFTVGGATPGSTTITAPDYADTISFRNSNGGNSGVLNSRINAPNATINVNVNGSWTFNSTGNIWARTSFVGTCGLVLGTDDALATGAFLNFATTTSYLDLNGKNQTVAGLAGGNSAATQIRNEGEADSTLTLSGLIADRSYSGVIGDGPTNTTSLVMNNGNAFTQTLTGTNTYTGETIISAGTLLVNGSLASGSVVTVEQNGTLGGTGTVGGATTISGTLAPGNSIGKLGLNNDLAFHSGSVFEWELNGTSTTGRGTNYDAVNVGGTLGGSDGIFRAVLTTGSFADAFWTSDRVWTDIFMNTAETSSVNFASIFTAMQYWEGDTNVTDTIGTYGSFGISGSTLQWTAIPEPSTALASLLLAAGLLRRRRP